MSKNTNRSRKEERKKWSDRPRSATSQSTGKYTKYINPTARHGAGAHLQQFNENEKDKNAESQANEFRRSIGKADGSVLTSGAGNSRHRIILPEADGIDDLGMLLPDHISTHDASSPILHASAGQSNTNQCHGDRTNDRREDLLNDPTWDDGEQNFQQRTESTGAKHLAISDGAVDAIRLHLLDGDLKDWEESEGCAHHAKQPTADIELPPEQFLGHGDRNTENVDDGADATGDQSSDDGVLLKLDIHEVNGESEDDIGRSDETSDHGECVL